MGAIPILLVLYTVLTLLFIPSSTKPINTNSSNNQGDFPMKTQITRAPPAAVAAASGAGPSFFCLPPLWSSPWAFPIWALVRCAT